VGNFLLVTGKKFPFDALLPIRKPASEKQGGRVWLKIQMATTESKRQIT
jgi:hypothetical protein